MARKQAEAIQNGNQAVLAESEVVWKGNELLRPFLVPIKNLKEDPRNANTHNDRSIEAIAASYVRFGQAKPVVCAKDGTVKDGNGQLVAASGLGWTHIAVIPSDLDGHELAAYALSVNRTAQLAEWDFEELSRQLKELEGYGAETADLGWDPGELETLMAGNGQPGTHQVSFEAKNGEVVEDPEGEWQGMPEFEHEDLTEGAAFIIRVFLKDDRELAALGDLLGKDLTGKKFVWFSKQPISETLEVVEGDS